LGNLAGYFLDIIAFIPVLRYFFILKTGLHGSAQYLHLVADVIDIIFFLHVITQGPEDPGQGITGGGATTMAHMQGPGRIGADEFYLYFLFTAGRGAGVFIFG